MIASRVRTLLTATVLVWLVAYGAWTADWVIQPMPHLLERSLRRIPMCVFGIGLCLGIAAILLRVENRPIPARLTIGVLLCAAGAMLHSAVGGVIFSFISPLWGPVTIWDMLANAIAEAWVFLAWLALYFALAADADARDSRVALADARTAEQRARNQALAQQINPHFLFNTLNAVSGLILEGDGQRAERVTMGLAALLRRSLERDTVEFVTLADEIEAQRRYLEIEEVRFEGRFRFIDSLPDAARALPVPSLILQPLVENAMKHGVGRSTRLVTLSITARVFAKHLEILVSDDALPDIAAPCVDGVGVGQANIRSRIALLYGADATLVCAEAVPHGYRSVLSLPTRSRL